MSNERALTIVEPAQVPQVVAVSDVSKDEIEFQRAIQEHKAIIKQAKEFKVRYNAAFVRITDAWFAENYPGVRYHLEFSDLDDDKNAVFGATLHINTPGTNAGQEFTEYLDQFWR